MSIWSRSWRSVEVSALRYMIPKCYLCAFLPQAAEWQYCIRQIRQSLSLKKPPGLSKVLQIVYTRCRKQMLLQRRLHNTFLCRAGEKNSRKGKAHSASRYLPSFAQIRRCICFYQKITITWMKISLNLFS